MKKALAAIFLLIAFTAYCEISETEKIEALIKSVENAPKGTIFIRNGTEYDAAKAADHLRLKYGNAKKRVKTAEQFIEYIASKSSISGKPYYIKFPDNNTVTSAEFFTTELTKINGQATSQKAP